MIGRFDVWRFFLGRADGRSYIPGKRVLRLVPFGFILVVVYSIQSSITRVSDFPLSFGKVRLSFVVREIKNPFTLGPRCCRFFPFVAGSLF